MLRTKEPLTRETLDGILQTLPVHVLCFDGALICRYAAPSGPQFLGRTASELLGRHADQIFPDGATFRPYVQAVLHTNQPWYAERVPYPAGPNGSWPAGTWRVHAQPFVPTQGGREYRDDSIPSQDDAGHRERHEPAVLVSCYDYGTEDLALTSVETGLLGTAPIGAFQAGSVAERHRTAMLLERVRTKLTVIRGFSQLLRRRVRHMQPGAEVQEVSRITEAISELDSLLTEYEESDRPTPRTGRTHRV
jgi:hypothetical protein